jgi:hypothetical protein
VDDKSRSTDQEQVGTTDEDEEVMSAAADDPTPERSDPRLRLFVAVLVALETLLIIAGAIALVVDSVIADNGNPAEALSLAVVALIVGAGLGICARAVLQGLRWTRGPVLTWQLLQAGVAMPLSTTRFWWIGVPLLAVAVVVGVLIIGRHVITQTDDRF